MSVLLKKILWTSVSEPDKPQNITDSLDLNLGRGLDIKNNVATIMLKNPMTEFNSSEEIQVEYVDSTGNIKFQEQDQIKTRFLFV